MRAETPPSKEAGAATNRFIAKRERIVEAATFFVNRNGIKGLTFVDVGRRIDVNSTAITYYFKRKEDLAAEVMERSLRALEEITAEAAALPTPKERVRRYMALSFAIQREARLGERPPIAHLSDLRALKDPARGELIARYETMARRIRGFFGDIETADRERRGLLTVRGQVFLIALFWKNSWIERYAVEDFARVEARLFEVFERGLDLRRTGVPLPPPEALVRAQLISDGGMSAEFLRAATELINERGYRGASVQHIAEHLNVTKGSFYHHLEGKDGLVETCFERSFERIERVQKEALLLEASDWERLAAVASTLVSAQLGQGAPLLRTTALQALPEEIRAKVVNRSMSVARRFAGMLSDGVAAGTVPAVDPLIASQVVMSTINGASDLRQWAARRESADALATYCSVLANGLFDD